MAKVQKSPHKSLDLWGSIVCNNKGGIQLRQCGGQLFAVASGPNPRNFPISRLYCGEYYSPYISEEDFLNYALSAANQGDIIAQESLAYYYILNKKEYRIGKGEGYKWAFEAAKKNSGLGMMLLGMMEQPGSIESRTWFSRAKDRLEKQCERGDEDSYYPLSFIFRTGLDAMSPVNAASHPTYKKNTIVCLKNAIRAGSVFKKEAEDTLFKLTGKIE